MLRREAVFLVSRAIALLLAIPAILNFVLTIPSQFFLFYLRNSSPLSVIAQAPIYSFRVIGLALLSSLFGLLLHLFVAACFWKCGPWVEGLLLPRPADEAEA